MTGNGLEEERRRPVVSTVEFRALLIESWLLAVIVFTGASVGLTRVGNVPSPVAIPAGFLVGTLVMYPAARVWYRTLGHEILFFRYFSIWFGVSVFMMIGMGLTS